MPFLAGQVLTADDLQSRVARTATATLDEDSATTDGTEISVLTVDASLVGGRTYGITWITALTSSVSGDVAQAKVYRGSLGANRIDLKRVSIDDTGGVGREVTCYGEYTPGSSEVATFIAAIDRFSGTGDVKVEAASGRLSWLMVDYVED